MRCYIVKWESGEYSDWYTNTDGVFFTYQDAVNYLDHKVIEMHQTLGYLFDQVHVETYTPNKTIDVFLHLKRVGTEYPRYDKNFTGSVWMVGYKGEVYDGDKFWYIVEEELYGHPHNILYRCNQNASCNDSDMCAKNQFADKLQYTPICDATTDVKYAARFEHVVDDLYAEKGLFDDDNNL